MMIQTISSIMIDGLIAGIEMKSEIPVQLSELKTIKLLHEQELQEFRQYKDRFLLCDSSAFSKDLEITQLRAENESLKSTINSMIDANAESILNTIEEIKTMMNNTPWLQWGEKLENMK